MLSFQLHLDFPNIPASGFLRISYLPQCAASPAHYILPNLITLIFYNVKNENYEAPSHAVFTILLCHRLYASSGQYISHDAVVINVIIVPTSYNFVLRYPPYVFF
jgi:hypothetical protein